MEVLRTMPTGNTVPYVQTANNIADFFTKAMHGSKQFFRFRRVIMNEPSDESDSA